MKRYERKFEEAIEKVDAYVAIAPIKKASEILSKKQKEYDNNQNKKNKIKDESSADFKKLLKQQIELEKELTDAIEELVNNPIIKKLSK